MAPALCHPPCVTRPRPLPVRFGLADSAFEQRQPEKGLITKQEVRAVSLDVTALIMCSFTQLFQSG